MARSLFPVSPRSRRLLLCGENLDAVDRVAGPCYTRAMARLFERDMEWECLHRPIVFRHMPLPSPPFTEGTNKFTIRRDKDFQLRLLVEGVMKPEEFRRRREAEDQIAAGTFLDQVDIEFDGPFDSRWLLRAHLEGVPNLAFVGRHREPRFKRRGILDHCRRRCTHRFSFSADNDVPDIGPLGPEAWRSDWFIGGPHDQVYCRQTRRRRTSQFRRERDFLTIATEEPPEGNLANFDHFVVEADGVRFALSKVPAQFSPAWCNAVSLDFLAPVPTEETREAIAEIVSFVLGRRLMQMGSTLFDRTGAVIEEEAVNPWGQGLQRLCRNGDNPPVPISPRPSVDTEKVLTQLIPKYLAGRKPLGMKDALLTYWLANEAFSGIDLALYGSAIEALKNGWFASTRSKSAGVHMSESAFNALLGDLVATARERLVASNGPPAVGNKLGIAYRMGGGEQLTAFFDELGLPIGPVERGAIRARNAPAHGGLKAGANERELIRHANAYRTLFDRTFLKMLDYGGTYVDRTSLGYPHRPLLEPCAGTAPP